MATTAGAVEEEGRRVRVRRGPERQTGVQEASAGGDGWDAGNPPVGGEMIEREVRQRVQGVGLEEGRLEASVGRRRGKPGTDAAGCAKVRQRPGARRDQRGPGPAEPGRDQRARKR
jgi:hypothetical protein